MSFMAATLVAARPERPSRARDHVRAPTEATLRGLRLRRAAGRLCSRSHGPSLVTECGRARRPRGEVAHGAQHQRPVLPRRSRSGRAAVRNTLCDLAMTTIAEQDSRARGQLGRPAEWVNMRIKIGEVEALYRYPVKSMAGESVSNSDVGWYGLDGDRRLAFRRVADRGGFPWLQASRLPELVRFVPVRLGPAVGKLPTHVRTPEGQELTVFGEELASEVGRRHGSPVEMMHLDRGIFDEASVSVISSATVNEVARLVEQRPDVRRFRPNILISSQRGVPFEEDEWVGGILWFGDLKEGTAIGITNRDERCSIVNVDPDSARPNPEVLKAVVRVRDNKTGVYGTVTRRGRVAIGQSVFFEPAAEYHERP